MFGITMATKYSLHLVTFFKQKLETLYRCHLYHIHQHFFCFTLHLKSGFVELSAVVLQTKENPTAQLCTTRILVCYRAGYVIYQLKNFSTNYLAGSDDSSCVGLVTKRFRVQIWQSKNVIVFISSFVQLRDHTLITFAQKGTQLVS